MFHNPPLIFAHSVCCNSGSYIISDRIIIKNENSYSVKTRVCPHRSYFMGTTGDVVKKIECALHGFCWDDKGNPENNHFYKLPQYGEAILGKSGLLFQHFTEPVDAAWVDSLASERSLQYTRSFTGTSNGSWLWLMDINADLLHFRPNGVHPRQSLETPIETLSIVSGDGWCQQINATGFWLFIFPFTAIEYEPGKLSVNRVTPNDINNEYGFSWHTQLYYDPKIDSNEQRVWEKLIDVYLEDIKAIENIKRPFYPLKKKVSDLEDHVIQWAKWYEKNLLQK